MDEMDSLVSRLSELVGREGTRPRSLWALQAAMDAAATEEVAGVLIVTIPAKLKDMVDISFTVGTVDIFTRWGR